MGFPEQQRAFFAAQTLATPCLTPEVMDNLLRKPNLHKRILQQAYLPDPNNPALFTPCPIWVKGDRFRKAWVADCYLYYPNSEYPATILALESFPLFKLNCSLKIEKLVFRCFQQQYRKLVRSFDVAAWCISGKSGGVPDPEFSRYLTFRGESGVVMQKKHLHDDPFYKPTTRYLVHFYQDIDPVPMENE